MPLDLSTLEKGDTLTINSYQKFPTKVRHIKSNEEGKIYVKTGNNRQGQELHTECGEIVLYQGLEKTLIGSVSVSKRDDKVPITELQESILWIAHEAERGVSIPTVSNKFDVSEQEAHEACMALGERDLLSFWTHRGYWSICEEGEEWLEENSTPPVSPYPDKHNRGADDGSLYSPRGVYSFIKRMQRDKEILGDYNGDMIGFDPEEPNISI